MLLDFQKLTKKEWLFIVFISFVAIIFYSLRLYSGNFFLTDSEEYLNTSKAILDGSYFLKTPENELVQMATKRPFLYPLFLIIQFFLNTESILFIQTLATILSFYLLVQCLKKLRTTLNSLLYIVTSLSTSIFIYSNLIMTEWLCSLLLTFLAFVLLHTFSKKRFVIIQIITLLLAATKPVFFPLIYFNLIYFSVYCFKKKTFSYALFLPSLFLFCYLALNNYKTGYRHFSSIENINLIDYNLYYFKSKKESREIADRWKDSVYHETAKYTTFKDQSIFLNKVGENEIRKNLFSYSWYHFYTSLRGMFDPGRFDIMTFFKKEDGKQGFLEILNSKKPLTSIISGNQIWLYILLFGILLINFLKIILFFIYFISNRKKHTPLINYLFLLIVFYILLSGPVNCSRLMMPIQLVVICFALTQLNEYKSKSKLQKKLTI
jgi:hypothetical protein